MRPLLDTGRSDFSLTGVRDLFGAPMSEYVLAWLLARQRGVLNRANAKTWDTGSERGLQGLQVGIMGTGSIGRAVAHSCHALGCEVRGLSRSGHHLPPFEACFTTDQTTPFAAGLDALIALLPDHAGTDGLVNAALLKHLNPGATLINAGRANSVILSDVLTALDIGQLGAAVLDVLATEPLPDTSELWQHQNLYITSHSAAPTPVGGIVEVFLQNYARYCRGDTLLHPISFERGY